MNNDLISREALKADIDSYIKRHNISELDKARAEWLVLELFKGFIDNAPAVAERPQGEWYEYIDKGLLKARHGNYVLYKVDYLLDNLAREVNIMEGARRMKGGAV